jgi:hypothetical protein
MVLVMWVLVLASAGKTLENAGFNNTSSKVKEGAMVSMILRFFVISDKMNLSGKKELANYFWLQKSKAFLKLLWKIKFQIIWIIKGV